MRMTETLLGQLQSHELVRKSQFENPYTILNQIAEQGKILKEYAERRNKLTPPVESAGIFLKDERQGKEDSFLKGQKKIERNSAIKFENNSVLFYSSEGKGIKSVSERRSFEFFA